MQKGYKIVFSGDSGVGKTSIIERFRSGKFKTIQQSTIGASFLCKKVYTRDGDINLAIWDTAGQERYQSMVRIYFRSAIVCVYVFDLSNKSSFLSLNKWFKSYENSKTEDISDSEYIYKHVKGTDLPLTILVGNKTDLCSTIDYQDEIDKFLVEKNINMYFVTSAYSGEGISKMFDDIALELTNCKRDKIKNYKQSDKISLKDDNNLIDFNIKKCNC